METPQPQPTAETSPTHSVADLISSLDPPTISPAAEIPQPVSVTGIADQPLEEIPTDGATGSPPESAPVIAPPQPGRLTRGWAAVKSAVSGIGNKTAVLNHIGEATKVAAGATGTAVGVTAYMAAEGVRASAHLAGRGAELAKPAGEALFNRMGQALEDRRAFGRSVADFALHSAATRGLSMGSRELAKSVVAMSGLAGTVGGGLTGTLVAGAFVGAMSGALVEYARQVNRNLDTKAEADPVLAAREAKFLLKFKELRHLDTLKATNSRAIWKAAAIGALAGAGAGALVEYVPAISEFVRNVPGVQGIRNIAVNLPGVQGTENLVGGAWHGAGETFDNLKHAAGLGGVHEAGQQAAQEAGNQAANEAGQQATQTVGETSNADLWNEHRTMLDNASQQTTQAVEGAGQATQTAVDHLPPTNIHDHVVSGSVIDHSLTYDGQPWVLLENGTKNIGEVFQTAGEAGIPVDQQVLAAKLQEAAGLWAHGQLTPSANPDLYTLFHLSNGTASIYKDLLNKDTLTSLGKLGIIAK